MGEYLIRQTLTIGNVNMHKNLRKSFRTRVLANLYCEQMSRTPGVSMYVIAQIGEAQPHD